MESALEGLFVEGAAGLTYDAAMTAAHCSEVRAAGTLAVDDELLVWWCATEPNRSTLSALWKRPELPDAARRELIRRLPLAACEAAAAGDAEALEIAAALPRGVFRQVVACFAGDDFGALGALVARRCTLRDLYLVAGAARADAGIAHTVASRITGTSLPAAASLRAQAFIEMHILAACDWPACVEDALRGWLARHRCDVADPALLGHSEILPDTHVLAEASLSAAGPDEILDATFDHGGLYRRVISDIVAAGARRARARGDRAAAGTWLALHLAGGSRRTRITIDDEGLAELALADGRALQVGAAGLSEEELCALAAIGIHRPAIRAIVIQRIFYYYNDAIRTLWGLLDDDARAEVLTSQSLRHAYGAGLVDIDDLFTAGPACQAILAVSGDAAAQLANAIAARVDFRPDAFDVLATLDAATLTLAEACDAALAAVRRGECRPGGHIDP
jgi:hypothetical protein